ncbi:MAG: exo-alpha-sialidase [Clostridia bacterium]|nr:exo-alpha-sialidase [Clostridia bacterium]
MSRHFKLLLPDEGTDIYAPCEGMSWGYRYGPSIMVHDGICEAWFASPGDGYEADWFTYRRSTDNGRTWSDEVVVLTPTPDSMDWFSVCDPTVIKYGGYYYIGYTSTVYADGGGVCNNAFVARSQNAEGPYEKWTGDGWGEQRGALRWMGRPAPILYFDEPWQNWGAGEPSFVVKDDVLYIYYTWTSKRADGSSYHMTRVATADITREDWPATVRYRGVAAVRTGGGHDSFDVVYCEDLDKFVAISTDKRFTADSMLAIYESDDGISFVRVNEIRANTSFMCHNSGISGDCLHHIRAGDVMLLAYAYGDAWGRWHTRLHRYTFADMEEDFYSDAPQKAIARSLVRFPYPAHPWVTVIAPEQHVYRLHPGDCAEIRLRRFDTCYRTEPVMDGVTFSNYDSSVIAFDGMHVRACGVGYTYVDAWYDGKCARFLVNVYPAETDLSEENRAVTGFRPVCTEYRIRRDENEEKQIRAIVSYGNGTWMEAGGDREPRITYETDAPEIVTVTETGHVTCAGADGTASVTVRCGEYSICVRVVVSSST